LRWLALFLALAALVTGALVAATPTLEMEGYHLPWSGPPRPAFTLWQSSTKAPQGDLFALVVAQNLRRPLLEVKGSVTGLYGISDLSFFMLDGRYVAYIPVSYSSDPGAATIDLTIVDHRRRTHRATATVKVETRRFPSESLTMGPQQTGLITDTKLEDDRKKVTAARAQPAPTPLWQGPFRLPVNDPVSSEFGFVRFVNGVAFGRHSGLDFESEDGQPVLAANAGRVVFAGDLYASGTSVILDHGLGLYTSYNHLREVTVAIGQLVASGDVVGRVGSTGFSTGPHLHFTMTLGSIPVNPWPWFAADPLTVISPALAIPLPAQPGR
jgi:murein DD-endopeptidase MepM/ murein hydrolase activator NlpD